MLKKLFSMAFMLAIVVSVSAQELLTPTFGYSKKKTSYITLQDGTEIKGIIDDVDRKKGNVELIKIKDESGKKHKLKPEVVKHMYLPPSGLDNLGKAIGFMEDARKWNDDKLNQDFLNQGYVYLETVNVKIGKKTMPLIMQLLNPTFSKKVKVYHDPYAKETASIGVGPAKVGGIAKSYFIMMENDPAAYKLEKKNYDDEFKTLWKSCDKLSATSDVNWRDLTKHIIEFTDCK